MKHAILITLLIIGVILMTMELTRNSFAKCTEKTTYKYIPRTIQEEADDPVFVTDVFKSMFEDPSPWVISSFDINRKKQEAINQYFASQA